MNDEGRRQSREEATGPIALSLRSIQAPSFPEDGFLLYGITQPHNVSNSEKCTRRGHDVMRVVARRDPKEA